jgi:exosome complex component RRP42
MNDLNKKYILSLLEKDIRLDKRKLDEYREIKIETGISPKSAEGSARVKIGDTEVVAGVKLDVGEPYPDTPNEGSLIVNAELLPLSSPDFETGPPDINSIELSRVIDRGIRESKMIDFKKLCIKKGEKIWLVFIDIYPINDDGNLFDAATLAAIAALKDTKFPKYDAKTGNVVYEKTNKALPITKTPISCTVVKIGKKYIIDPNYEEENAIDTRLTIVIHDNKIHAMQKGGEKTLNNEDIEKMIDLAMKKSKELSKLIK